MVRSLARIFLVVTILLVAVPSIQAAESRMEDRSGWSVSRTFLSWSFLADLWETLSLAWGENGCILDPDGRALDSAWGENGCILDPNGSCRD